MADDVVKIFGSSFAVLEQAPFVRWVQPAPQIKNTSKVVAVYQQQHDGQQRAESLQLSYPGSPVRLEPNLNYILDFCLSEALVQPGLRVNEPKEARNINTVVITDEYRQIFGAEWQIYFETRETGRLPTAAAPAPGSTVNFLRVPNPGRRHVGFRFFANSSTCTADVVAVGLPAGVNQQTVLSAVAESTFAAGVADTIPMEWLVKVTSTVGVPTAIGCWLTFNESA
jgi:hypothetical protein